MYFRDIFVYPRFPDNLKKLLTLAYNIWSLWDKDAVKLYFKIDGDLFRKSGRNPIVFLHSLSNEKLRQLENDKVFLSELDKIWKKFEDYQTKQTDFQNIFNNSNIAYFSMEYGLHDSLPIFAGGLGILSGDHIKGASDLGLPLYGVGLLYRYGYFTQRIMVNGMQEEIFRENTPYYMPIKEVKDKTGSSIFVEVPILDKIINAKIWQIIVGNNRVFLLDTNIEKNPPEYRDITNYLYVADKEKRFQQEILLGIGGYRMLKKLNINPKVYHLNEGHSAFLLIEHLIDCINEEKLSFEEAQILVKNSSIFTTHTPVEAGNENFSIQIVKKYLDRYLLSSNIDPQAIYDMGFMRDDKNTFWLPALALRLSSNANAVSKIHGNVSRKMWAKGFSNLLEKEIPIDSITNGVHYSWFSTDLNRVFEQSLGTSYIGKREVLNISDNISSVADDEIWGIHIHQKQKMINFIRNKFTSDLLANGASPDKINKVSKILNPKFFTIGFARRFAPYKRPSILFKDKERLARILKNPDRPVQIVCSGKAHPADFMGKNLIKEIIDFTYQYECEDRVIFIENYSLNIAQNLVQGVDIWLNTPIKPLEACGTSGMKAGINGVLNFSVLDGWWPECYDKNNGWAITAGEPYSNDALRDLADSNQIYDILEDEIIPLYYDQNENGIPEKWVWMMKQSIITTFKNFNIERMLKEYSDKFYKEISDSVNFLGKNNYENLKKISDEYNILKQFSTKIYIKDFFTDIDKYPILRSEDSISVEAYVYLDQLDPSFIEVEIFCLSEKLDGYIAQKLDFVEKYQDNVAKYSGTFKLENSGFQQIAIRIVPANKYIRKSFPDFIIWKA